MPAVNRPLRRQTRARAWLEALESRCLLSVSLDPLGQIGGTCRTVDVSGNYAYAVEHHSISVLNISDPSNPRPVGKIRLGNQAFITDLQVQGNVLYAAANNDGLRIIDVSDPTSPRLTGWAYAVGGIHTVCVQGSRAYVGGTFGLAVFDVTDPSAPVSLGELGTLSTPIGDIQIVGSLAYTTCYQAGWQVFDVSNPQQITRVGGSDTPGNAWHLKVAGAYAYVADEATGVLVFNVSNPASPTLVATCDTPDYAEGIDLAGNFAYVADVNGLQIIDISNPAAPLLRGKGFNTIGTAYDVRYSNGLAYVADNERGVQIVDVANPDALTLRGSAQTTGDASVVQVIGNRAYVLDQRYELIVLDVTDPAKPSVLGFVGLTGAGYDLHVVGNWAFVATSLGLNVVDVSNPAAPVLRSNDFTTTYYGLQVVGNKAYIAGDTRGIRVIDVTDPTKPVKQPFFDTPGVARDVQILGSLAYVADGDAGLSILDMSNASAPVVVGRCDTPGFAVGISVSGNLAYVADYNKGLQIIDVSNPALPKLIGGFDTPGNALNVALAAAGLAVVSDEAGGIQVIDVSNPAAPAAATSFATDGPVRQVGVAGDIAYAAVGNNGVQILHIAGIDASPPVVASASADMNARQQLLIRFSEPMSGASLSSAKLSLAGPNGVESFAGFVSYDSATNTATFGSPALLTDGNYHATLAAGAVTDVAGNPLASDFTFDFFVVTADANHDRKVDFGDLVVLAQNYGTPSGATFDKGDFNYDGKVDFADLVLLAQHYGTTLAAPALAVPEAIAPVTAARTPSSKKSLFSLQPVKRLAAKDVKSIARQR